MSNPDVALVAHALLRSNDAAPARTLVDVFRATVAQVPDEPALDNGSDRLTYAELDDVAASLALELRARGIGAGDRVAVRISSGTTDQHSAILGVLYAGAAYVPIDVDDPVERADLIMQESAAAAVISDGLTVTLLQDRGAAPVSPSDFGSAESGPDLEDDAWIIFTSGSTGTPKGVAVTHRSAAAFVDAESSMFCQDAPLGPGDRVMAGLSIAFDASCEEMWLAWAHGACLVPAPRSLVKSGADLGPWLIANNISVVSTVPTLVLLWPAEALERVRLLILGGEACPPEIGSRLATTNREVWNTYGPTEATVVACGARVRADEPVRIGLPLAGWDLAVVDSDGRPVPDGADGELMIGGVGLARYLDPVKDAEKYAPAPHLGWDRAYRSGDRVRHDGEGLVFVGRLDDQIKIGGRRIELGEIDNALLDLPGVVAAAAAVRTTSAGNKILVGYVSVEEGFDPQTSDRVLRDRLPASNVPRVAVVDTIPVRTSGKVDRDALPWPVGDSTVVVDQLGATEQWIAALWFDILGANVQAEDDDFFGLGGSSLMAAQLVAKLRERHPEVTVADVYEHSTLAALASHVDQMGESTSERNEPVRPVPFKTQLGQVAFLVPLRMAGSLRWIAWLIAAAAFTRLAWDWSWLPPVPIWLAALLVVSFCSAPGRLMWGVAGVRIMRRGIVQGSHPRGGKIHLRLWACERWMDEWGMSSLAGAGLVRWQARLLGARVERGVDLHALPPVTGWLSVGRNASIEPEADLSGWWIDGGQVHVGAISIGQRARIGVRSTLGPGVSIGDDAEVAAGSTVLSDIAADMFASGAPAAVVGRTRGPAMTQQAPWRRRWVLLYSLTATLLSGLPLISLVAAVVVVSPWLTSVSGVGELVTRMLILAAPVALLAYLLLMVMIWALVRVLSAGLHPGIHAVHGLHAWRAWTILRVLDEARTWLFPLYSSSATPLWLRSLGASIGPDVEASTVLMLPRFTTVAKGAFLADDTMLGMYELGSGWLRIDQVKIGRHAFVGNSGMAAPGRKVPKGGLVAVLSAAPRRTKAKKGTSWLGSPPTKLRRTAEEADRSRTYAPSPGLRVARAVIEAARLVAVVLDVVLGAVWIGLMVVLADVIGWWAAVLAAGPVLLALGVVAAGLASLAKWVLVGRVRRTNYPLWSTFVWRSELADSFVEVLAARWFCGWASGTPVLTMWLRTLGASIGSGVWCESYWLPEPDLVTLGDGTTVNRGCVVQTHLFHDRILSMDTVTLAPGATLGPHAVALPASSLGRHATVGPGSLVMRGEVVPESTRWIGNPIGPWA